MYILEIKRQSGDMVGHVSVADVKHLSILTNILEESRTVTSFTVTAPGTGFLTQTDFRFGGYTKWLNK